MTRMTLRLVLSVGGAAIAAAAMLATGESGAAQTGKPFSLPFGQPPGPSTWYVSQPYGNTVFAYFERAGLYRQGQGLHMGLDLAAACGTPVLAMADGTVLSVDGPGGSLPHNLMISHSGGLVSFYGHLLERPRLVEGQPVRRGEQVALSGDMFGTCYSSPHLHVEVRDASLQTLHNPVDFIDADWHKILMLGARGPDFERDLEAPGRWQSIDDQPSIRLGGGLLNGYQNAWPSE